MFKRDAEHLLGYKRSPENEAELKEFTDILWSMFVNALKSSGNVGISINPMDYLLVSSHTTGWRSCHNIINGEYRTGGISYMLDKVSLVGYAYDKKIISGMANSCQRRSSLSSSGGQWFS